ncbi:MAG: alanine racemase [Solirubrobacterales bacterium]
MSPTGMRAVARIDLDALRRNLEVVRGVVGDGVGIGPVIKSDAYGHGMWLCGSALAEAGVDRFCVATADEAVAAREISSEIPVVVLGALTGPELEVAIGARAELPVWEEGFIDRVERLAERAPGPTKLHLKYDSGMGRLGCRDPERLLRMAERIASSDDLELEAVWTHFATADDRSDPFLDEQLEGFLGVVEAVRTEHPETLAHAANSAAVFREAASHLDLVRPGVALYGMDPFGRDPSDLGLEPVLSLVSLIGSLRTLTEGDSVGYGRAWTASGSTEVATVPIGYGDGYRRGLSGKAPVLVGGRRLPVAGTISMDNVAVDLGPPGEAEVGIGDEVVLIGRDGEERILAEDLAGLLDTINYEVTCGLSARVPREAAGSR